MGIVSRQSKRHVAAWAAVTAIAGGLVTSADAAAPTKAEYIAKADALCISAEHRLAPDIRAMRRANTKTWSELATYARIQGRGLVIDRTLLAQVRSVPSPREDQQKVDEIWDAFADDLADLQKTDTALTNRDIRAANSDERAAGSAVLLHRRLARAFGLNACAAPPPPTK